MQFRTLNRITEHISQKLHAKQKSSFAFRDESAQAQRFLSHDEITTARKVRERFKSITGYNRLLEAALLLPAQEFEERFIPPFVQLFEKYKHHPESFDFLLQSIQDELVREAEQLKAANPDGAAVGYLPYVDTFRVRVLREVVEVQNGMFLE
jgi:hypothetical protein